VERKAVTNLTILDMLASLPVGIPHVPGAYERGESDGYHGCVPAEDSRAYLSGYAQGLEYRRIRQAIEREKAGRAVMGDPHAATYSPKTARG
jgi:hypothetical protein